MHFYKRVHYLFSHLLLQVDHKQENSKLINYTSSHESSTKEKSMQATSKSSLQSSTEEKNKLVIIKSSLQSSTTAQLHLPPLIYRPATAQHLFPPLQVYDRFYRHLWEALQSNAWDPRYTIVVSTIGQGMMRSLKLLASSLSNKEPVCGSRRLG